MKKIIILLLLLLAISPTSVFADAKSDYEYQMSQYRRSYVEFTQLKRDYLANSTLDNQQKSLILAKQVMLSRDLAKGAYARYMMDLINAQNTGYAAFQPVLVRLSEATSFYSFNAQKSQTITTPSDLKEFSSKYNIDSIIPDRSFFYGQVAAKLAQLLRFQLDAKDILDSIRPKLPSPQPIPLQARLNDIPVQADLINKKIEALTKLIIPEVEEGPIAPEQYFTKITEGLTDIRSNQASLVDQLVDIDLNYAQL